MYIKNWRGWLLGAVTAGGVVVAFLVSPIPQDPAYHAFADRRTFFGISNFWGVFSNFPFVLVGAFGLSRFSQLEPAALRSAYALFCIGAIFVGFGSAYYHYAPSTQTLVWDRLPMTVAFMALFAMIVGDRVSERLGGEMLWQLVLAGVASVGYWHWTELQGRGDLRAYAVVQFLPMLLLPLMLLLYRSKGDGTPWLWGTLGLYLLAKVAEYFDSAIYEALVVASGHSIKHVLGAGAVLCAVFSMQRSVSK